VCREEGAGILKNIDKMVRLTDAVVKSTKLPVTVKTRLGWDDDTIRINEVAERLQDVGIQALAIHGRTRQQMYKGSADWTKIAEVKSNPRIHIPIFGNGDITTGEKAMEYRNRYGVDGIMIGRASIGYPWIFREIRAYMETGVVLAPPTIAERVEVTRKHLAQSVLWKGDKLGVLEMRRHYTNYFKGLFGIKEYRARLVTEEDPDVLMDILSEISIRYAQDQLLTEAV
jgi:nifR3 family TIM-barrel protein